MPQNFRQGPLCRAGRRFPGQHRACSGPGCHSGRPEGRAGYLAWRTAQAASHAERVGGMMAAAGYDTPDIDAVARLLRKDPEERYQSASALLADLARVDVISGQLDALPSGAAGGARPSGREKPTGRSQADSTTSITSHG